MSDQFDFAHEHKLERNGGEVGDAVVDGHRFEVITGTGRRRRWSKARILVESFVPRTNVLEAVHQRPTLPTVLPAPNSQRKLAA